MQSINNFLCEKFKINSQDLKHIHSSLFSEIQNEICDEGEYHTFDFNEGQKKYKKGFLFFCPGDDFFGIEGYNDINKYIEERSMDEDEYNEIDKLKINESCDLGAVQYIRIW